MSIIRAIPKDDGRVEIRHIVPANMLFDETKPTTLGVLTKQAFIKAGRDNGIETIFAGCQTADAAQRVASQKGIPLVLV
ncbi:MAG: hypothetical protein J0L77_01170 [Alphaproteobacteria bacterium]|nr:hypothetical protein [Alphaproteobacteria bacterium]